MTRPVHRHPAATAALALVAGAALGLGTGGCDNKCPTENPKISAVPTCTGAAAMQAGATVSVTIRTCPTCNQTAPECTVIPPGADGIIQLDPLVQACNGSGSCPPACSVSGVTCTFTAPAAGNYTILVNDPATGPVQVPFDTIASGGQTACAG